MTDVTGKLLLVDDNVINLQVLEQGFLLESYQLLFARDGTTAIQLAHEEQPDLILLDIAMPEMNGLDVCRTLKASPTTADIPIIFLSARDQPVDKIRGLEAGGIDYITKPFDFAEVSARVKVHMLLRRQQQQILLRQQQDLETLERLNEMKTEILRRLKHDVQSPVTNILLSVSMIKRDGMVADSRGLEFLDRIVKSTQAISGLFSNVIELAKTEYVLEPRIQQIRIGGFINDVISACVSDAEQKQISVSVIYESIAPTYVASFDIDRMTSVFLNLLSNAIKYSPVGSEIKISIDQRGSMLLFKVADNGYGIREEDLPNLFDKYYRGQQPAVDAGGTGLGLYIVKVNVEQHGGEVWVESEYGRGTVFYITIPQ